MSLVRWTFILVFIFVQLECSAATIGVVSGLKLSKDIIFVVAKVWTFVEQNADVTEYAIPLLHRQEDELFKKLKGIDSKLTNIASEIDSMGVLNQEIVSTIEELPERIRIELWLNDLLNYLTQIDVNYQRMLEYTTKQKFYEKSTLEDFIQNVISHDTNSVINLLQRIYAFVLPQCTGLCETDLFVKLKDAMQDAKSNTLCNIKYSPQQVLYKLYDVVALAEVKGYIMIQFSYMLLKLYGKGNFRNEVADTRRKYEERTNHAAKSIGDLLRTVSRELWRCDPKEHAKGETYEQITNLLQGYVLNENNLNKDEKCYETCTAYNYVKLTEIKKKSSNIQRACNGNVINCHDIDSDISVCMAPCCDARRYEFIQYKNSKRLGSKEDCLQKTTKLGSWSYRFFWRCSYCFCLCDEEGSLSDRYVNMKSVLSDIKNNKVVTGLRFVKKNRIIHLQIQEGEMLPALKINSTTLRWKPVENYKINDRKVFSGQEFHTLTWDKRQIDLDDLEADDEHVLTGVRFKEIGSNLNFEIYTTKFNFETGKLQPECSKWIDNLSDRTEVRLNHPDIPIKYYPSIPRSHTNQYIKFTHSDIDKDVAQTTVPFLDAQKVESSEPVPLAGGGLFFKGRPSSGGFIAPKIITYDVSKHLKPVFAIPDRQQ